MKKKDILRVALLSAVVSGAIVSPVSAVDVNNANDFVKQNNYKGKAVLNVKNDITLTNSELPTIPQKANPVVNGNGHSISGSINSGYTLNSKNSSLTFNDITFSINEAITGTSALNMSGGLVNENNGSLFFNNSNLNKNSLTMELDGKEDINLYGGLIYSGDSSINLSNLNMNNNIISTSISSSGNFAYQKNNIYGGLINSLSNSFVYNSGNISHNNIVANTHSSIGGLQLTSPESHITGGIANFSAGSAELSNLDIFSNTISAKSTVNAQAGLERRPHSSVRGGVFSNAQGSILKVSSSNIRNNTINVTSAMQGVDGGTKAHLVGGAINNEGNLFLDSTNFISNNYSLSLVKPNTNTELTANGGAIYNAGTTNISGNSIFMNNILTAQVVKPLGGAIYNATNATLNFNSGDATFEGNKAGADLNDIYFDASSSMNVNDGATVNIGSGLQSKDTSANINIYNGGNLVMMKGNNSANYSGNLNIDGILTYAGDSTTLATLDNANKILSKTGAIKYEITDDFVLNPTAIQKLNIKDNQFNFIQHGKNKITLGGNNSSLKSNLTIKSGSVYATDNTYFGAGSVATVNSGGMLNYQTNKEFDKKVNLNDGKLVIDGTGATSNILISTKAYEALKDFSGNNSTVEFVNSSNSVLNYQYDKTLSNDAKHLNVIFDNANVNLGTNIIKDNVQFKTASTLNLLNNKIDEVVFNKFDVIGANNNLNLDIDLKNNLSDTINVATTSSGKINLGNLSVTGGKGEKSFSYKILNGGLLFNDAVKEGVESEVYKYKVTANADSLDFLATSMTAGGLKYQSKNVGGVREFNFIGESVPYVINSDLELMQAGTLNVKGKDDVAANSIFSGDNKSSFFEVQSGSTLNLDNLTVQNSKASAVGASSNIDGAVANVKGNANFTNVVLNNNTADRNGGAIYAGANAVVNIKDSTISNNSAVEGSAIYNQGGKFRIENTVFTGNSGNSSIYNTGVIDYIANNGVDNVFDNNSTIKNLGTINFTTGTNKILIKDAVVGNSANNKAGKININGDVDFYKTLSDLTLNQIAGNSIFYDSINNSIFTNNAGNMDLMKGATNSAFKVNAGNVNLKGGDILGGSVVVNNGGNFNLSGANTNISANISGVGNIKQTNNNLVLSGSNKGFTGTVNSQNSSLTMNSSSRFGNGANINLDSSNLNYTLGLANELSVADHMNVSLANNSKYSINGNALANTINISTNFADNVTLKDSTNTIAFTNGNYALDTSLSDGANIANVEFTNSKLTLGQNSYSDNLKLLGDVNLNLKDSKTVDYIFNNFDSVGNNNKVSFDIDLTNDKTDTINVNEASSGNLSVGNLNIIGDNGSIIDKTYTVLGGDIKFNDYEISVFESNIYKYNVKATGNSVILKAVDMAAGGLKYQTHQAMGEREFRFIGDKTYAINSDLEVMLAGILGVHGKDAVAANSVFSGDNSYSFFEVQADSTLNLDNLTIQNAYASSQGLSKVINGSVVNLLENNAQANISNVVMDNNKAEGDGGTIYASAGTNFRLMNSQILNSNHINPNALNGGAIYTAGANAEIRDSIINGNVAKNNGGNIYAGANSNITISDSSILNGAAQNGAGIYSDSSAPDIMRGKINNNHAVLSGGGIFAANKSLFRVAYSEISNNTATDGAGIYANSSKIDFSNVNFVGNDAKNNGGAIFAEKINDSVIADSTIKGNKAVSGAGIYADNSKIDLNTVELSGNIASQNGGTIITNNISKIVINNSKILNNTALEGSAIYNNADNIIDINNFEISGNTGDSSIYNAGVINFSTENQDSIIKNNSTIKNFNKMAFTTDTNKISVYDAIVGDVNNKAASEFVLNGNVDFYNNIQNSTITKNKGNSNISGVISNSVVKNNFGDITFNGNISDTEIVNKVGNVFINSNADKLNLTNISGNSKVTSNVNNSNIVQRGGNLDLDALVQNSKITQNADILNIGRNVLAGNNALDNTKLIINSGSANLLGGNIAGSVITIADVGTLNVGTNDATISAAFLGVGTINQNGGKTLTLTGKNNKFAGTLNSNDSTLVMDTSSRFANGAKINLDNSKMNYSITDANELSLVDYMKITLANNSKYNINANNLANTVNITGDFVKNITLNDSTNTISLNNGKFNLGTDFSDATNKANLDVANSTLMFGQTSFKDNINLVENVLVDVKNNQTDNYTFENLTSGTNNSISFDVDLTNDKADTINVTGAGSGKLSIGNLNIFGNNGSLLDKTYTILGSGLTFDASNAMTHESSVYKYNVQASGSDIILKATDMVAGGLKHQSSDTSADREFHFVNNENIYEIDSDLDQMAEGTLSVFGKGDDASKNIMSGSSQNSCFEVGPGSKVNINDVTIKDAYASNDGTSNNINGAVANVTSKGNNPKAEANFDNVILDSNKADGNGGAIYVEGSNAVANINNSIIKNNTATEGSAIYNKGGEVNITNTNIEGNTGNSSIYNSGNININVNNGNYQIANNSSIKNVGTINVNTTADKKLTISDKVLGNPDDNTKGIININGNVDFNALVSDSTINQNSGNTNYADKVNNSIFNIEQGNTNFNSTVSNSVVSQKAGQTIFNGAVDNLVLGMESGSTEFKSTLAGATINQTSGSSIYNGKVSDANITITDGSANFKDLVETSHITQNGGETSFAKTLNGSQLDINKGNSSIVSAYISKINVSNDNSVLDINGVAGKDALNTSNLNINKGTVNLNNGNVSNGTIAVGETSKLNIKSSSDISADISGKGTITQSGTNSSVKLGGANSSFNGVYNVLNDSTLVMNSNSQFGTPSNINLDNATFDYTLLNDITLDGVNFSKISMKNNSTANFKGKSQGREYKANVSLDGNAFDVDPSNNKMNFSNMSVLLNNPNEQNKTALSFNNTNLKLGANNWLNSMELTKTDLDLVNHHEGDNYTFENLNAVGNDNTISLDISLELEKVGEVYNPVVDTISAKNSSGIVNLSKLFITGDNGEVDNFNKSTQGGLFQVIKNTGTSPNNLQLAVADNLEIFSAATNIYRYGVKSGSKEHTADSLKIIPKGFSSTDTLRELNQYVGDAGYGNRSFNFVLDPQDAKKPLVYNIYRDLDTTSTGHFSVLGRTVEGKKSVLSGELKEFVLDKDNPLVTKNADGSITYNGETIAQDKYTLDPNENYVIKVGALGNDSGEGARGSFFELTNNTNFDMSELEVTKALRKADDTIKDGSVIYANNAEAIVNVDNVDFVSNEVLGGNGGAIANLNSKSFRIANSKFNTNNANLNGGAIYTNSSMYIDHTDFTENKAGKLGGAIYSANNSLVINGGTFSANDAVSGGAIYNEAGQLIAKAATFNSNKVTENGGAMYNNAASMIVESSNFESNSGATLGGAVYTVAEDSKIKDSKFISNSAKSGAGIYNTGANLLVSGGEFTNNVATENGGAVYNNASDAKFENVKFDSNKGLNGAGIYNTGAKLSVTGGEFNNNIATENGGAVYNNANDAKFENVKFNSNKGLNGAGIYNTGANLSVTGGEFNNNISTENGGAIYNTLAGLQVTNTKFNSNEAKSGAAIYNEGNDLKVVGSEFISNNSTNGGAIYNKGQNGVVNNSKFTSNHATADGGAIKDLGGLRILNSSFDDNISDGKGGAIYTSVINTYIKDSDFGTTKVNKMATGVLNDIYMDDNAKVTFETTHGTTHSINSGIAGKQTSTFEKTGTGALNLNGNNNDMLGKFDVQKGSVNYLANEATDSFVSGDVNVNADAILSMNIANSLQEDLHNLSGTGSVNKLGAGKLTLLGDNSNYNGRFSINEGVVDYTKVDSNTKFFGNNSIVDVQSTLNYKTDDKANEILTAVGSGIINKNGTGDLEFKYTADGDKFTGKISSNDKGKLIVDTSTTINPEFAIEVNNGSKLDYTVATTSTNNMSAMNITMNGGNNTATFNNGTYQLDQEITGLTNTDKLLFNNAVVKFIKDTYSLGQYKLDNSLIDLANDNQYKAYNVNNLELGNNVRLAIDVEIHSDEVLANKYDQLTSTNGSGQIAVTELNISDKYSDRGLYSPITLDNVVAGNITLSNNLSVSSWSTDVYDYSVAVGANKQSIILTATNIATANSLKIQNQKDGTRGFNFTKTDEYKIASDLGTTNSGNFTVKGFIDGANKTTINGNQNSMFEVSKAGTTLNIKDVDITNAYTVENGSVLSNTRQDSNILISNSNITNNKSDGLGGAIYTEGLLSLKDVSFSGNADSNGANDIYMANENAQVFYETTTKQSISSGIAGVGSFNKLGTSQLDLSGNNVNFTGNMNIANGIVNYVQNTATDSYVSGLTNIGTGAKLVVNNNLANMNLNQIVGAGTFEKNGSKDLILKGNQSGFTGNANINQGNVIYDTKLANGYFGGKTTLADNTSLILKGSDKIVLSNMNGTGKIDKTNTNDLIFTGNNSGFTGDLSVNANTTLRMDSNATIGKIHEGTFGANSTINLQNTSAVLNGDSWTTNPNPASIEDLQFGNLVFDGDVNLFLDVDLANSKSDKITADNVSGTGSFIIGNGGLNVVSDTLLKDTKTQLVSSNLVNRVILEEAAKEVMGPIQKYNVNYADGYLMFAAQGGTKPTYDDVNPAILAGPVAAQFGGYLNQLNSYQEAFRNMDMYMLMTKAQRDALKYRNKQASASNSNVLFDPTISRYENKAGWFRPYATFESVSLKNGPKVSNVAYGSYFGGESEMIDLGHGWDGMYGVYVGYNGSHQAYNGNNIYQNGGTLGVVGMAYKGNFFTGWTANVGANAGESHTMFGHEDFAMMMSGVATNTGYNIELADGKFIIQPHYLMSYTFVNTFDYRTASGVKMTSDPLHAIQIEPGVKFIGNLNNGWQPYMGVSMVWNLMDKTEFMANDVSLPSLSVKPFVKYGVGVRKSWGERFTGFFQTYLTNGGRNGVGLQFGMRWVCGDDGQPKKISKPVKTTKNTVKTEKKVIKSLSQKNNNLM